MIGYIGKNKPEYYQGEIMEFGFFIGIAGRADESAVGAIMHFQNLIWIMVYSSARGSSPWEKRRDHATTIRHLE